MKSRIIFLFAVLFLIWSGLIFRAAYLQVLPNSKLGNLEKRQFNTMITLEPRRGIIYDKNKKELAISVSSFSLYADPKMVKSGPYVARKLARYLQVPSQKLKEKLINRNRRFVWLQRHLTEEQKKYILSWNEPGLSFVEEPMRVYPHENLLSQTLGFVGIDGEGLEGIELKFDEYLKGEKKQINLLRDARGRPLILNGQIFSDRPDGYNVQLTIDSELQYMLEKELFHALQTYKAETATGVILDVHTSEVLAMANIPTFNVNQPQKYKIENKRNRVITDAFEPGSTIKTVVIAGALKEGLIKPGTVFNCENGKMQIGDQVIREADSQHAFDRLSVSEILAKSSNIGATKIAFLLGAEKVRQTLLNFGFGTKTEIELGGESNGILHALPWRPHLLSNVSFGHGLSATPLQIANAYAAIANGGVLNKPYIVESLYNTETQDEIKFHPQKIRDVLTPEQAATMTLMLTAATGPMGTGYKARTTGYPVAGKTGTAQKVRKGGLGYEPNSYISSFAGYIPANQPKYVIYVAVDNPQNDYYGAQVAAPIFSQVAQYLMRIKGVPPVLIAESDVIENKKKEVIVPIEPQILNENFNEDRVPHLTGLTLREVIQKIHGQKVDLRIQGSGVVSETIPAYGEEYNKNKLLKVKLSSANEIQ